MKTLKEIREDKWKEKLNWQLKGTDIISDPELEAVKEWLTQKRQKYDKPTAHWKNPLELIDELLEELQEE